MKKTSTKKVVVYLADLVHNYAKSNDNWMVPLNILKLASYLNVHLKDQVVIRLFKFPDLLAEAILKVPPDILGVSNYLWNSELSKNMLSFAKECSPGMMTVMGGPNICEEEKAMSEFFRSVKCDYYVSGQGESCFSALVGLLAEGMDIRSIVTHPSLNGGWYYDGLNRVAVFRPSQRSIDNLDDIPSPYLQGLADDFLQAGLAPMIETNRGCPFSCTYCCWGKGQKKICHHGVAYVKEEINYLARHAKNKLLMITDGNFGLFGERDMQVARELQAAHSQYNWPTNIVVNWGQVKSSGSLEIAEVLKGICVMRQSSQSFDPDVLRAIKRRNITDEEWERIIYFSESRGIDSFGELILMLPEETMDSYLMALRKLFNMDIKAINTNQLQLLSGAEISSHESREKYGFKTKWRLLENCCGLYNGQPAMESEEIVVQTNTFSGEESLRCRSLNWLIMMSWTLKRHDVLLCFLRSLGINPTDFLLRAVMGYAKAPFRVRELFDSFIVDARSELFDSPEDLVRYYGQEKGAEFLKEGGFGKLNTIYSGRAMACAQDFTDYYIETALDMLREKGLLHDINVLAIRDCVDYLNSRSVQLEELDQLGCIGEIRKEKRFSFDFISWERNRLHGKLVDYYRPDGIKVLFYSTKEQVEALNEYLARFARFSSEYRMRKLHEPYFGVKRQYLFFSVSV